MITVYGDILSVAKDYDKVCIPHVANCYHVMGVGVAKRLSKTHPQVLAADKRTLITETKLGSNSIAYINDSFLIVNMYAQAKYGTQPTRNDNDPSGYYLPFHLRYDALYSCMLNITSIVDTDYTLVFPAFGSGYAGGDWSIISVMIESLWKNYERILAV